MGQARRQEIQQEQRAHQEEPRLWVKGVINPFHTHMKKSLPSPKIIVCCTHLSIQLHCHNIVERDLQGVFVHVSFQFQIHFFDPMSLSTPACSKPDCNYSHCCNFSLCLRAYMKFGSWCNLKKPTVTYSHIRFWRMCNFQFYISILASNLLPTQC